jgi:hypothetical protein
MSLQETVVGKWHGLGCSEMQFVNSYSFYVYQEFRPRQCSGLKKERKWKITVGNRSKGT